MVQPPAPAEQVLKMRLTSLPEFLLSVFSRVCGPPGPTITSAAVVGILSNSVFRMPSGVCLSPRLTSGSVSNFPRIYCVPPKLAEEGEVKRSGLMPKRARARGSILPLHFIWSKVRMTSCLLRSASRRMPRRIWKTLSFSLVSLVDRYASPSIFYLISELLYC